MKRIKRDIDNSGMSLLLVIVTMMFVTIIAAVVIAITYRNLETMRNSLGSTKSFYTAESAMDEMRTKFYEWSDEAFRKSYEDWLGRYNSVPESEREKLFKTGYVSELETVINDKFMCYFGESPRDIDELFVNFTSDRVSWNPEYEPSIEKNVEEAYMTVKDISLVYTDAEGYETVITTDLKLDVKYDGLSHNTLDKSDADCAAYAIISDCRIGNTPGTSARIDGNVYAGGYDRDKEAYGDAGLLFDGGSLDISADKIVSRGDIEFTNEAVLKAKGSGVAGSAEDSEYCNIWAQGFGLTGVGAAVMDIRGNCYVYDDTTVDAAKSSFTVKGSYYGYNTNNAAGHMTDADNIELRMGTPEGSSSIVVNKNDTKVDLTGCDPVWIAGKTFVSVPKLYGEADILDTNVSFPQGEAVSYKGLQAAYLMPGDCIVGIGHNPMSLEEYERLQNDEDVFIDLDKSRKNGGVALAGYVQIDKPYRVATVDYSASAENKVVYLYLNFISTDKATEYFQEYAVKHGELLESNMAVLGGGSILFNPASLVTTGNMLSYDGSKHNPELSVTDGKYTVFDEKIETKEAELNNRYNGLITALDEDYSGVGAAQFMTDNFVDFSKVDGNTEEELDYVLSGGKKYKLITGDDTNINTNTNAIIISTGDVKVAAGAAVHGLIMARGSVELTGASVYAEPEDVAELILNEEEVAKYFSFHTSSEIGTTSGGMFSSDLIVADYINWRKN